MQTQAIQTQAQSDKLMNLAKETKILKSGFNYVIIKHNDDIFSRESTLLPSKWSKKKYIMFFKSCHRDGSESLTHFVCSNDLEDLQNRAFGFKSWYNYVSGLYKQLQGDILPLR